MKAGMLIAALSLSACTYHVRHLPSPAPQELQSRAEADGFTVGALPYYTVEGSKRALSEDVTGRFWPVYVAVHNGTQAMGMIQVSDCRLLSSDGKVSLPASAGEMFAEYRVDPDDAATGGALTGGLVGGMLAEDSANDANQAMLRDWNEKELTGYIVGDGEVTSGLLYFRANQGKPPFVVEITVENRDTKDTVVVRVPLSPAEGDPGS